MAIAFVQSASGGIGSTDTLTVAYGSDNTAGNLLVAGGGSTTGVYSHTWSDNSSNSWSKVAEDNNHGELCTSIGYAPNCAAGANTVTLTNSASGFRLVAAIAEYSGADTSAPLGQQAVNGGSGSPTASVGPVTTTTDNELVVLTVTTIIATSAYYSGTDMTERVDEDGIRRLFFGDKIHATAGSVSAQVTKGGNDAWGGGMATFKEASGATTVRPRSLLTLGCGC